jgi:hypothetical protein
LNTTARIARPDRSQSRRTGHRIGAGTFHRNRREAIAVVARELRRREELVTGGKVRGT